jgi:hypothetical protein
LAPRTPVDLAAAEPAVVRRERTLNRDTVRELLAAAVQKLADAKQASISGPTRLEAAYDASLFCAHAIFAVRGYRIAAQPGHHKIAIEGLAAELKLSETVHGELEELLRVRNTKYTGFIRVNPADLKTSLEIAQRVLSETERWFGEEHPNLLKA